MTVVSSALYSGVWQQFLDTIEAYVTDPDTRGTKWIWSGEPDKLLETPSFYPAIIVRSAKVRGDENITLGNPGLVNVPMEIEITTYATSAEKLDTVLNSVYNSIDTRRESVFSINGTKELNRGGEVSDTVMRGALKVHYNAMIWEFSFQH